MNAEEIEKLAEAKLKEMFEEKPVKLCQFMICILGENAINANSEKTSLSAHITVNNKRYAVKNVTTFKEITE